MTDASALACRLQERRKKLFGNPDWNGMDFLEVSDDQLSLCVHFFGLVPAGVTVENIRIEGGRRIRDLHAVKVEIERANDPELDDCLRISLDRFGDFSIYRLCLVEKVVPSTDAPDMAGEVGYRPLSGIDPRYACLCFSFKVDCPSDLDCRQDQACPPEVFPAPEINYLAKDYASFRQLIYDRLALIMPDWQERHVPDLGVTLVELLAYAGDYLSYYQDAVATEAYLDTARRRISVRRHARLVDYRMHEGNNARAWITVCTRTDLDPIKAGNLYFITGFPDIKAASGRVVQQADLEQVPGNGYEVFEPLVSDPEATFQFRAAHCEIPFYTWGDLECCLAQGATRATLLDERTPSPITSTTTAATQASRALDIKSGDVLIFEEVLGPTTGNPADADPAHRHAVRLTKVTPSVDGLLGRLVLEIEWAVEDALPFSLCLSARLPAPDCARIDDISVARGNVVLVDHGRSVCEPIGPVPPKETVGECACDGSVVERRTTPERFTPTLEQAPLSFGQPLPAEAPASAQIVQDPRLALPRVELQEYVGTDAPGPAWQTQYDLLASNGDARHFVAEMDDDGRAHLRFGDGDLGRVPAAGTTFRACYRVGNGPAGNVGRDTITYLVLREGSLSADSIEPRNPLPAQGGAAPEPVAEVKLFAPGAFRARRERAITAEDYAELAQASPKLQRAAAELRWMGSWYEAQVAVDPLCTETADAALLAEIAGDLYKYRRMGHDLAVVPARYVPIEVAMEVCVLPHHARGTVKAELLKVFSNRRLADGTPGFFHPDNLSFGDGIYVSRLIAAAKGVEGVDAVRLLKLARLDDSMPPRLLPVGGGIGVPANGVLPMASMEIAQLDNDPSFPENGKLELILRGGL
ncbi:MAG: putative baseplate assembly protein [Hydrogenophilales bacterium]|nr:putative baseplate assembly protein [Hydrogenophilales bacterium]